MNLLQTFSEVASKYNAMRTNPGELQKLLLNSGKINQEQYNIIKNYSPSQTGQFLMSNGILQQGQMGQLTQMANQLKQFMGV